MTDRAPHVLRHGHPLPFASWTWTWTLTWTSTSASASPLHRCALLVFLLASARALACSVAGNVEPLSEVRDGEARDGVADGAESSDGDDAADRPDGDVPCPAELRCGAACCGTGERCDLGRCRPDCGGRAVCGDPPACCAVDQVCLGDACVPLGEACDPCGGCAAGRFCDPSLGRCLPAGAVDAACVYVPPPGGFDPVPLWTWEGEGSATPEIHHVVMMPVVAPLDDDDGDGRITGCDNPEVAFIACPAGLGNDGWLRVLDGRTGVLEAEANDAADRLANQTQIAAGDIDGDGRVELVVGLAGTNTVCTGWWGWHGNLLPAAFRLEGGVLRRVWTATERTTTACGGPAIADLEGDGAVEVLYGDLVLHGADGTLRWRAANGPGLNFDCATSNIASLPLAADLDGDGNLEALVGRTAYREDGTVRWTRADLPEGLPAVADLDGDGLPEIAYVAAGQFSVLNHDGSNLCGPVRPEAARIGIGGAPTIADFDGAAGGGPEIGVAGRSRYSVFRPDCTLLATADTFDDSAVTSSTVFDMEGDGVAEIAYADENHLYVFRYDGTDRLAVVMQVENSSGTGLEGPVVADVNADGRAEFVVVSNGATGGVRAFRDSRDRWASTRPIWNQHTYHVTNVADDGAIPAPEVPHWTVDGGNSFRRNRLLGNEQWVPDLLPDGIDADGTSCPESLVLLGRVRNGGALTAPAGIPVTFYRGDPAAPGDPLGTVRTSGPIPPGGSEPIRLEWSVPAADRDRVLEFHYVVDDDGRGSGERTECREDNNRSPPLSVTCLLG